MNQPRECANQLDWLAFCYAAGELSSVEAERFEARLADHQSAREALARAIELTQLVAAAESQTVELAVPASRLRPDWQSRLAWMAIGGLASLLLAILWSGALGPMWHRQRVAGASARQGELAAAWTQTRADLASVKEAGLWPAGPSLAVGADDAEADQNALDLSSWPLDDLAIDSLSSDALGGDTAPSWMTAAVFGLADRVVDASGEPAAGPFANEHSENQ